MGEVFLLGSKYYQASGKSFDPRRAIVIEDGESRSCMVIQVSVSRSALQN